MCLTYYRPQRSCGQGNIFTPVCHSVHRGGGSASVHAGIPPPPGAGTPPWEQAHTPGSRHPPGPGTPPPGKQTRAYGLRAAGTHPTGMHSCLSMDVCSTPGKDKSKILCCNSKLFHCCPQSMVT